MLVDLSEREQALDPSHSFIVEAPAGSGKTGLLVQRFLRLLGVVERPESIVAMTFMRKAAAEMKGRIYESLVAAHDGSPVGSDFDLDTRNLALDALAQDQRKSWNLLSDPGRLQIQTIDSVSGMLARQMPVVSQFGGESKIVERCTYPLTGIGCVSRIYTDLAVIDVTPHGLRVVETVEGLEHAELERITGLPLLPAA